MDVQVALIGSRMWRRLGQGTSTAIRMPYAWPMEQARPETIRGPTKACRQSAVAGAVAGACGRTQLNDSRASAARIRLAAPLPYLERYWHLPSPARFSRA